MNKAAIHVPFMCQVHNGMKRDIKINANISRTYLKPPWHTPIAIFQTSKNP